MRPSRPPTRTIEIGPAPYPRVGAKGLVLIGVFWTVFGAGVTAILYLSGLTVSGDATLVGLLSFALLGAYTWAALTLPLFHLTQRLNLTGAATWRPVRVAGLLVVGLVVSSLVSVAVSFISATVLGSLDLLSGSLAGADGTWRITRYRFPHDVLACFLVLTSGLARDYFFRYRSRLAEAGALRTQLAEARLQVLRTQLNPHFLFNTLNAVAALVQTDPKGVRRMIALLSDMLRETLDGGSEPEVPLERELEFLGRYVAIMEIRFRGDFETRISADSDVVHALVPHLILQPLVENAMKHGVGHGSDLGLVEVTAARDDGELVLSVRDSGGGSAMDPAPVDGARTPDAPWDQQGGFGLRFTRERLRELYGDRGRLELRSEEGGTVVEVRLPYHMDDEPPHHSGAAVIEGAGALTA